jgi:hypothetical protein
MAWWEVKLLQGFSFWVLLNTFVYGVFARWEISQCLGCSKSPGRAKTFEALT